MYTEDLLHTYLSAPSSKNARINNNKDEECVGSLAHAGYSASSDVRYVCVVMD